MRWWGLLVPVIAWAASPEFNVDTKPVAGGAELVTVFSRSEAGEVPLVSVLRDTLGDTDPDNDRLRYVWVLTSARPGLLQRAVASLPFFYFHPDLGKNADRRPVPVIDLAAAGHGVWTTLAGSMTQAMALDPNGALIRTSTRSYRSNLQDHRRLHLVEGLAVLSQLEDDPEARALLSDPELLEIEARLSLAGKPLGGLVDAERLPEAYFKQRTRTQEMRGHNWELLRQRAEANGLYFDPLGMGVYPTHALLWIARSEVNLRRSFDSQFLGIADPYGDARLKNWAGYSVTRTVGEKTEELIPLALYSLDYPKVPLLLADFRAMYAPKRREMVRRAATDTVSGVLGISKWGNWPYFTGAWIWNFVRTQHGAASDRAARLNAYAEVRQWLALDPALDDGLRMELERRLEALGMNPLEESVFDEANIARRQYAALLRYADNPHGLVARLKHDREAEEHSYEHGLPARLARLGLFVHHEHTNAATLTALDRERRIDRHVRFLEAVARSSPQAEVVWNMEEVKRAIGELAAAGFEERSTRVVQRIMSQTQDEETRALCQRALDAGQ